ISGALRARRPTPRRVRVFAVLFLAGAATVTLSLLRGQERPAQNAAPAQTATLVQTTPAAAKLRAGANLTAFQKEILLSAQRGADWTYRMHGVKGRFLEGRLPSVAQDVEGDHYVRQAYATIALARAARLTGEERLAARATQAVLALLE